MKEQIVSLIIGSILTAFHIVWVIAMIRKIIPNKFSSMLIHVLSAICTLSILLVLWITDVNFYFWLAFSVILFGISGCLFVFGAVYKSLSIRFLLMTKAQGKLVSFDLLDVLITKVSFAERTNILCNMGLAIKEKGGYRISKKGLRVAKRIVWLRKLFRIKTTGLY